MVPVYLTTRTPSIDILLNMRFKIKNMNAETKKSKKGKKSFWKPWTWAKKTPVVPVLRLAGTIGVSTPLKPGLSMAGVESIIDKAFSVSGAKAVAIQINSPGGSPVQSALIYKRIRGLAEEKELPVYVFAEDVAASGGYMLSLAGDHIYADASSIIGSIGVIMGGFGFDKFITKHDIERRVYTTGKNKNTLDAFLPAKQEDIDRVLVIQKHIHDNFIDMVKERRGEKLTDSGDKLFTGEFWSGNQALELGLIDGISDLHTKMQEIYGDDVKLKPISQSKGLLSFMKPSSSVSGNAAGLASLLDGSGLANDVVSAIEERAIWSRYGF